MADQNKTVTTTPKKKACNSDGFVPVSKTITTTYQNSKGVKRVVKETTTAPKAKKVQAKKTAQAKPMTAKKPTATKGGKK